MHKNDKHPNLKLNNWRSLYWRLPLWLVYSLLLRMLPGWQYLIRHNKNDKWNQNSDWDWIKRSKVICIAVGGLSTGGSGKTPLVDTLLGWVTQQGWKSVCLSRGYARRGCSDMMRIQLSENENTAWQDNSAYWLGDEVAMLANKHTHIPFYVGANRGACLRTANRWDDPQLAILDDAFQHMAFVQKGKIRNWLLNVLLWDATQPLSTARLLPWGELRETLLGAKRADVILLTHSDHTNTDLRIEEWRARGIIAPIFCCKENLLEITTLDSNKYPLSYLKGKDVGIWCGIAHPEHLDQSLVKLGANIKNRCYFPDHHPYTAKDAQQLKQQLAKNQTWVTTAKDAVKLKKLMDSEDSKAILILHSALKPEGAFFDFLLEFISHRVLT